MFLEKHVKNNSSEFPGFKLVGYCEIGIPMFRRKLYCSMVSKKRLAVVDEFVLRYSTLNLSFDDISSVMGLPRELIEQSWYNLLSKELIDRSNVLTKKGREYLETYKLDNYEILEVNVAINGLNGNIEVDNSNMMSSRSLRELGLKSVMPLIDIPNIENIDLRKLKQTIRKLRKLNNDEDEMELMGLHNVIAKATNYKRLFLLIFADFSGDKNFRYMVFDGWQRMENYEDCILELDNSGSSVIKINMSSYFEDNKSHLLSELLPNLDESQEMNIGVLSEEWEKLLSEARTNVCISLPLVDMAEISDYFIETLAKCSSRGVNVEVFITGREFTNGYQKRQCEKLLNINKITVSNYPCFDSKILMIDDTTAVVSDFRKTELNLVHSKACFAEYGYKIHSEDAISLIKKRINGLRRVQTNISKDINEKWYREKMLSIISLYYQFDDTIKQKNNIGWLEEDAIPDVQKLVSYGLVKNEEMYKDFFNLINKSLVENVENYWTRNNLKGYFWNGFKNEYPDLQKILHKIKLYRHSTHHLALDDKNKPTYYKFLDEDLGGSMPMFVRGGYQRIQLKIIESLESELKRLCS